MPILRCFRNRLDLSIIAQWRWNTMRGTWTSLGDPSAKGIKLWVSIIIGYWRTKVAEWGKSNYGPRKQSWHKMYQFFRLRRKRFFGGLGKDIWLFWGKSRCKNDTACATASPFESLLHFMFVQRDEMKQILFHKYFSLIFFEGVCILHTVLIYPKWLCPGCHHYHYYLMIILFYS